MNTIFFFNNYILMFHKIKLVYKVLEVYVQMLKHCCNAFMKIYFFIKHYITDFCSNKVGIL